MVLARIAREQGCDGLAIINPAWMRFAAQIRPARFMQFAERIFGLKAKASAELECALAGVDKFEQFLRSIDCPTRLSEIGIGDEKLQRIAQDALIVLPDEQGRLVGRPPMTEKDILTTMSLAL